MSAADRVRKLAALAGSDNEHEANSAARQACRIIRQGGVTISNAGRETVIGRARPSVQGPFARRHDAWAEVCAACDEEIPPGDAFSCPDGYVHGDCIPAHERP